MASNLEAAWNEFTLSLQQLLILGADPEEISKVTDRELEDEREDQTTVAEVFDHTFIVYVYGPGKPSHWATTIGDPLTPVSIDCDPDGDDLRLFTFTCTHPKTRPELKAYVDNLKKREQSVIKSRPLRIVNRKAFFKVAQFEEDFGDGEALGNHQLGWTYTGLPKILIVIQTPKESWDTAVRYKRQYPIRFDFTAYSREYDEERLAQKLDFYLQGAGVNKSADVQEVVCVKAPKTLFSALFIKHRCGLGNSKFQGVAVWTFDLPLGTRATCKQSRKAFDEALANNCKIELEIEAVVLADKQDQVQEQLWALVVELNEEEAFFLEAQ